MDIIKQRIENINRNASFNRSTAELLEDAFHNDVKSTPTQVENTEKLIATTSTPANDVAVQLKPLKRKLFAPPSLFPENSPILAPVPPQKTDKKTATQKRKRYELPSSEKSTITTKNVEKKPMLVKQSRIVKKTNSRRSTLLFEEAPIRKTNLDSKQITSTVPSMIASSMASMVKRDSTSPSLVFTSMHQSQIDVISEVRQD